MLKLKKPSMSDMTFEREFTDELAFLADKGKAYISIKCRAGGWANPDLVRMRDDIQVWRQSKALSMASLAKEPEKYAEQSAAMEKEIGGKMFQAVYDCCVVSWATNIENDGKPMECNRDNFVALADVRISEIAEYFVDFARYVDDLGNFRSDMERQTAKN